MPIIEIEHKKEKGPLKPTFAQKLDKQTEQTIDEEEDNLNEESLLEKFNREEINKEFRKRIKKYYIFKVIKTPCI